MITDVQLCLPHLPPPAMTPADGLVIKIFISLSLSLSLSPLLTHTHTHTHTHTQACSIHLHVQTDRHTYNELHTHTHIYNYIHDICTKCIFCMDITASCSLCMMCHPILFTQHNASCKSLLFHSHTHQAEKSKLSTYNNKHGDSYRHEVIHNLI